MARPVHVCRQCVRLPCSSVLVGGACRLCQYHSTIGKHQCPYQSQNNKYSLHDAVSPLISSQSLMEILSSISQTRLRTLGYNPSSSTPLLETQHNSLLHS